MNKLIQKNNDEETGTGKWLSQLYCADCFESFPIGYSMQRCTYCKDFMCNFCYKNSTIKLCRRCRLNLKVSNLLSLIDLNNFLIEILHNKDTEKLKCLTLHELKILSKSKMPRHFHREIIKLIKRKIKENNEK